VYLTTSVPSASCTIVVTMDGVELPYDETGTEGWMWGDEGNGEIILLGGTGTTAGSNASTQLAATVTCDPPEGGARDATGEPSRDAADAASDRAADVDAD
jgi:hypothetical protein